MSSPKSHWNTKLLKRGHKCITWKIISSFVKQWKVIFFTFTQIYILLITNSKTFLESMYWRLFFKCFFFTGIVAISININMLLLSVDLALVQWKVIFYFYADLHFFVQIYWRLFLQGLYFFTRNVAVAVIINMFSVGLALVQGY